MEPLGRVLDYFGVASGVALSMRNCSAISFVGTHDNTFTITVASTFTGSYATPGNIITRYYQRASEDGTTAWTKQTQSASNAVVQASDYETFFTVFGSQLPDPKCYIKCTASSPGDGQLVAILTDLTVSRAPANLTILSA
jgi:hypothetical protein